MSKHTENSSLREKLIEHLFVGELLKHSWLKSNGSLEISQPEVDCAGYDLIAEHGIVMRHVQLKASFLGGKTSTQKVHLRLADKPSGCVVWVYFDRKTLALGPFLFFGGQPGLPLADLSGKKIARHTKGNKDGLKAERPNIRVLNKGDFQKIETIEELYQQMFGCEI
jgi:hypothetical protein